MSKTDFEFIDEAISYDKDAGRFVWKYRPKHHFPSEREWKRWNSRHANTEAGSLQLNGYIHINILGKHRKAHRVAWILCNGEWPEHEIDHINGDRADNRLVNLRDVPKSKNGKNTAKPNSGSTPRVGVRMHCSGKWQARITVDGRATSLGLYDKIEDAILAREKAEKMHGFHENHGRQKSFEAEKK